MLKALKVQSLKSSAGKFAKQGSQPYAGHRVVWSGPQYKQAVSHHLLCLNGMFPKIYRQVSGKLNRHPELNDCRKIKELMKDAGLTIREDAVGNTFGRWEGSDKQAGMCLTNSLSH